jgi:hypothetical protein
MQVIANTIQSFMWIFLLLFIFIYIYALLGMSIFGGDLDFPDSPTRMGKISKIKKKKKF